MTMQNEGRAKLTEEIGEVMTELGHLLQVVGKVEAFGLGDHPDGNGELKVRLENEIADVQASLHFMTEKLGLDNQRMDKRTAEKISLFMKWDDPLFEDDYKSRASM